MNARFVTAAVAAMLAMAGAVSAFALPNTSAALAEHIDALVRDGYEHAAASIEGLNDLQRRGADRRSVLQALGTVEARAGAATRAALHADALQALAGDDPSGLMAASGQLVRAQIAENAGQSEQAAAHAQAALSTFQQRCHGAAEAIGVPAGCDYRAAWAALMLLERRASGLGLTVNATAHAQAALELATAAGDTRRQAINLGSLAVLAQGREEREAAVWLMAQARRLVTRSSDPVQQARLASVQARLAAAQGDTQGNLQALQEALALAESAKAPRLEAQMLINLGDAYARMNRPADALRLAERALPVVRRHNDVRGERVLLNNIGIAKIGVGRVADGKHDMVQALELWRRTGETGHQVQTLLEFGEALARAGDARGALELYHRERALSAELMRANRAIALKELQVRNDAEARQRDIELLGRDNALKTEALANRDLMQTIGWLLAAVMALASVLATLLYRRVRETHRRLAASHRQLQAQSERDPLTNLANRRHFQSVMAAHAGGFEGALLLVDIDHFKHINDEHGHAAGDQVLVEVARRLDDAVRHGDLVVRWGGEEFLILAPRAAPEQAEQMAARILRALGAEPVVLVDGALRVTASIGYARFPLPPYGSVVSWEEAINLADMALYTAKNQGRNRAFGITSTSAATPEALREIATDFDRAWHAGEVTLLQTIGPEPREAVQVA